jgi:DNA-binding transcriptional regulator GbsR (MarR family)
MKEMKEEYSNQQRRWYDKDPVLSEAVRTLEESDDQTQIRVALNLIKIIIEHNIEDEKFEAVDDIINAVGSGLDDNRRGRWYDIDTTLRTAMNMLQNCPPDTQKEIAKEMAKMVVDKIKTDESENEEE